MKAAHCFILSNKFSDNPHQADSDTIIRCLAVKSHCQDVPMSVQLIKTENDVHASHLTQAQLLTLEQMVMVCGGL